MTAGIVSHLTNADALHQRRRVATCPICAAATAPTPTIDFLLVFMPSGGRWPRICACTTS